MKSPGVLWLFSQVFLDLVPHFDGSYRTEKESSADSRKVSTGRRFLRVGVNEDLLVKRDFPMRWFRLAFWLPALLASVLLVAPGSACAENILVKNNSGQPVVVQGTAIVKGQLVRDRAHLVQSTEVTPAIVLPGNKVLTVYDARNANRVLTQIPLPGGNLDMVLEIVPDPTSPGGVRLIRR